MASDSDDLDISLFSEKFKKAKKKLKKGRTDEMQTGDNTKEKVRDKAGKRTHKLETLSDKFDSHSSGSNFTGLLLNRNLTVGEDLSYKQSKKFKRKIKNTGKAKIVCDVDSDESSNKLQRLSGRSGQKQSELYAERYKKSPEKLNKSKNEFEKMRRTKVNLATIETSDSDSDNMYNESTSKGLVGETVSSSSSGEQDFVNPDRKSSERDRLSQRLVRLANESISKGHVREFKSSSSTGEQDFEDEDRKPHGERDRLSQRLVKLANDSVSKRHVDESESSSSDGEEDFEDEDRMFHSKSDGLSQGLATEEEEVTSENEEEVEDKYAVIKKELANIPLEDLVKIKEKLGLKEFSKIMHGGKSDGHRTKRVFHRANKNRPVEMSSKRRVPILRNINMPKKKVQRDPRFDDLSGDYKEEYFERNYSFLKDIKSREKEAVQRKLSKLKNEEKKEKLQYLLNRMKQQEHRTKQKERQKALEASVKQKEKALVKERKTPYFLKKAERKKLELAEKYKELQKSGKLDQYLSKKRKKNAQKVKRRLPKKHIKT